MTDFLSYEKYVGSDSEDDSERTESDENIKEFSGFDKESVTEETQELSSMSNIIKDLNEKTCSESSDDSNRIYYIICNIKKK